MFPFKKNEVQDYGNLIIVVGGRLEMMPIENESEGRVQAGEYLLPVTEGKEYFSRFGDRYLVYHLDLPSLVESQTLYNIRESEVLKGLFDVPQPKKFLDMLPLIICGLIAFFAIVIHH
ncbi:hypothetical protein REC12_15440 [Desulfosporosinus sp. PR]|uniref:hypothetical protein n=1 Tax=Candidatus Desulfosporosinus nitrosoreducens TaxID=3401928 RepID=UPI0027FFB26C|nr:hypothetical protein [Desulfosporosinus sp. PR]MDQ7094989.1 hypothetical protein [Desulfosporosinus sp. PR]